MKSETRTLTVYWTMHSGKRFSASLSESAAASMLSGHCTYRDDPRGWTLESASESVLVVRGRPVAKPSRRFALGTSGEFITLGKPVLLPHVEWPCPHCNRQHTSALCEPNDRQAAPADSPQLWFCERGDGIVLVEW